MNAIKILAVGIVFTLGAYIFGYTSGQIDAKKEKDARLCIDNKYSVKERPNCNLSAENIVTGFPDGETGWFKKFPQAGICGLYSCKGDKQGTYECFEEIKLDRQSD